MKHNTTYHTTKTVMLLGSSMPIPEIIEKIVSMEHRYKSRNLFSNPSNWTEIEQEIHSYRTTDSLLAVLMFLTEGALLHSCVSEYMEVWHNLLVEMEQTQALIFVPQRVFKADFYDTSIKKAYCRKKGINLNDLDVFRKQYIDREEIIPQDAMNEFKEGAKDVLRMIQAHGIEIVPYNKDKSFIVRTYRLLDDADEGVFLKLYVPYGRYQADQLASFLRLLENYLQQVEGIQFYIDVRKTGQGQVYLFRTIQISQPSLDIELAISRFESFMSLCQHDLKSAETILRRNGFNSAEAASLLSKYIRDYQRIMLDMRHEYEQKTLTLRQHLEASAIELTHDNLLPSETSDSPSALLSLARDPSSITINISNSSINTNSLAAQSVVEQMINGSITHTSEDKKLIEMFEAHTNYMEAISLKSELEQLKDESSSPETRKSAKQKIISFLYKVAPTIGQTALDLLSAYLQKVLIGK